jgi:hypothetical protein
MATSVSICSNALLMLGAQSINDLSEDNDRAKLANNLYSATRDEILRIHPWNSCIKRAVLAPDAIAPDFDYSYQFTLPSDWLRTLSVGQYGYEDDYRTEGRKILADTNVLYLRYIFANYNEGAWDAGLVSLMTLKMAALMAYPITQSASKEQIQIEKFEMEKRRVCAIDGQDDPPETLGNFRLLSSRY